MAYYKGPPSDHFDGSHFYNPGVGEAPGFVDVLRWKLTSTRKPWPQNIPAPLKDVPPPLVTGDKLRVSYIGHATVLLQTGGLNILTDPVWSDRASPFSFAGPKRAQAPGIDFEVLPKIDIIVLSHNHYDHLDIASLKRLIARDNPQIITPLGNDATVLKHAPTARVEAIDWYQSCQYKGARLLCGPALHWSSRSPFDRDRALWGAFTIETSAGRIYFAGDSGYHGHFRDAFTKLGPFRFALIPIGAYLPRWFMGHHHMNPADAVQAFEDLGSPPSLALHHDVFALADEVFGEAKRDLLTALQAKNISPDKFQAPPPGGVIEID